MSTMLMTLLFGLSTMMSAEHKLLGPLEAINGALMIGVSTAAMISTFQHEINATPGARRRRRQWLRPSSWQWLSAG
jgi:hypothetical protein